MAGTPVASPQVSSTVGLKNVVIAPLVTDTDAEHTYGELQLLAGAIEASITPENADPDIQYADDVEFDTLYPDPELSFKTKMADVPLAIQEQIFGNQIDDNGVLVRTASDKPGYFAVGFKSEKADGNFRYVWLYKVRAKTSEDKNQIIQIANIFRASIIDVSVASLTLAVIGDESKAEAIQNLLKEFGILELVRTGMVALERGQFTIDEQTKVKGEYDYGKNVLREGL